MEGRHFGAQCSFALLSLWRTGARKTPLQAGA